MSLDEQDQIFGRLTRQRSESRRCLAALHAKISDIAKNLKLAGEELSRLLDPASFEPAVSARAAANTIPSKEDLLALIHEFSAEQERLSDIERQIERFER